MTIGVIGIGYVGAITGVCFTELGNHIIFVDVDEKKIKAINSGKSPVFEPELENLIRKNKEKIVATSDFREAIQNSDITFICVGTPSKSDGSINLEYVSSASTEIGKALKNKEDFHVVVVKSTVLPTTTEEIVKPIIEENSGKISFKDFGLASNPEFLRESNAIEDFFNTDRVVIGVKDQKTKEILEKVYSSFDCPKIITNIKTAEMIKYVSNAFLSTKISFSNEIGNICKRFGIDAHEVFEGVGFDHRINPSFFGAGIGFGGSCFPKDVQALITKAEELGECPRILKAALKVNEKQPGKMIGLLKKHLSLSDKKIGVLGLSFKPDTDDIRESRAIPIVDLLIKNGAKVIAYDPKAMDNFKKIFPQIEYATSADKVLDSDAILIVTEWKEFEDLDYTNKIVIDGRRIEKAKKEAAVYEGVCW